VKHIRKVALDLVGRYRVGVEPVVYLVRGRTTKGKKKGTQHNREGTWGGGGRGKRKENNSSHRQLSLSQTCRQCCPTGKHPSIHPSPHTHTHTQCFHDRADGSNTQIPAASVTGWLSRVVAGERLNSAAPDEQRMETLAFISVSAAVGPNSHCHNPID